MFNPCCPCLSWHYPKHQSALTSSKRWSSPMAKVLAPSPKMLWLQLKPRTGPWFPCENWAAILPPEPPAWIRKCRRQWGTYARDRFRWSQEAGVFFYLGIENVDIWIVHNSHLRFFKILVGGTPFTVPLLTILYAIMRFFQLTRLWQHNDRHLFWDWFQKSQEAWCSPQLLILDLSKTSVSHFVTPTLAARRVRSWIM